MTGLEIALFILGAAFVIISFFITADNEKNEKNEKKSTDIPDTGELEALGARIINDVNKKTETLVEDTESRLEQLSNDKIIAVDEYSGQVIEKIDANHREAVFLYQMLQEKEEELKSTMLQLDNVRIECERLMRENSITVPDADTADVKAPPVQDTDTAPAGQQTSGMASAKPKKNPYMPKKQVEKPRLDSEEGLSDKNREIIALYKKKKSVLEISKLLGMGQGEVKLIIDLYCR